MNLFVFDRNPVKAAAGLDDKRIGSALREANQMMSTALIQSGVEGAEVGPGLLCAPTHQHHPVTLWVGQNQSTFAWTLRYAHTIAREYRRRYHKDHAAAERLQYIAGFVSCLPAGPMLPFQNSARHGGLGLDFTHLPVPESYREYLQERWKTDKRLPTYTNREWPKWAQRSDQ